MNLREQLRAVRKQLKSTDEQNVKLRVRLFGATRIDQEVYLGSYLKGANLNGTDLATQLKLLNTLGLRCEIRLNTNGAISLHALKRVPV